MRKLTAAISAAAIAATLLIPVTAGAATTDDFNYNFDSAFASEEWTPSGGTGTNIEKLNSGISDGKLLLKKTATSSPLYKITKNGLAIKDNYTFSFDVTLGSQEKTTQLLVDIMDSRSAENARNQIVINNNSAGNANYVQLSNKAALNTQTLVYTNDTSKTVYLTKGKTYTFTYKVEGKNYSLTVTGNNLAANTLIGTFGDDYISTNSIIFAANTNDTEGIWIDNISIKTESQETAALANTVEINNVVAENVEAPNISVDNNGVITYNGTSMKFYKTTVTAGTKTVKGGTITAKANDKEISNNFKLEVAPKGTGTFYNVVGVDGNSYGLAIDWSYTFNEE